MPNITTNHAITYTNNYTGDEPEGAELNQINK